MYTYILKENNTTKIKLHKILNQAWVLKTKLSNKITTSDVNKLIEKLYPYSSHLKISGAGGGGFIYLNMKGDSSKIKDILKTKFKSLEINLCNSGTTIIYKE